MIMVTFDMMFYNSMTLYFGLVCVSGYALCVDLRPFICCHMVIAFDCRLFIVVLITLYLASMHCCLDSILCRITKQLLSESRLLLN